MSKVSKTKRYIELTIIITRVYILPIAISFDLIENHFYCRYYFLN